MGRFYRALKEASRSLPDIAEAVPQVESEIPATQDPQALPVLDYAEAMEAIAPSARPRRDAHHPDGIPGAPHHNGTLGIPAKVAIDQKARLIPHTPDPVILEHYRRLRTKIIQEQEKRPFTNLVVASPDPQDGKTVTTLNLALSFGMLPSYRVLVVDGDLRKGSLGKWLGVGDHAGLSELIEGTAELEDVVLKCDEIPVYFMVRGNASAPPGDLLHSTRLAAQFKKMAQHFSLVLVDSPPVNLVTDVQMLAGACDAVLLVARAFATSRKALEKTVKDLSPFRIIGSVLNRGMRADLYRNYKGYY